MLLAVVWGRCYNLWLWPLMVLLWLDPGFAVERCSWIGVANMRPLKARSTRSGQA